MNVINVVHEENGEITQAWDDVTGNEPDPQLTVKARQEEMEQFRKHKVYEKVKEEVCWQITGKAPIGTRWIDINKGD
eukprot:2599543-Pyramimonas_sp.AAC.1